MNYTYVINRVCSELVEASAESGEGFDTSRLGDRLQQLAKESPDDPVWRALSFACNYHLSIDPEGLVPEEAFSCGPYSPMFVLNAGDGRYNVFPIPLEQVGVDVLDIWVSFAGDEALHPLPRARLADLLWVRKHGDRAKWIKAAVGGYTQAAAVSEVHLVERGTLLGRAVAVSKESGNQNEPLKQAALQALDELTREIFESPDDSFGVVGRALTVLIDAGYDCETRLMEAMQRYGGDPWRDSDLRLLAIKASVDEADKRRLGAERIQAFEQAAERSTGLRRLAFLEHAREVALSLDDRGTAERLTVRIQQTEVSGDMECIELSYSVDEATMRSMIAPIVGDDTLSDALSRFARYLIPNLDSETIEGLVNERNNVAPLQAIIGKTRFGPDGTCVSLPSGSEERHLADIGDMKAEQITSTVGFFGPAIVRSLDERYDMPQTFAECFGQVIPTEAVKTIAAAHERWKVGDLRSAVAVLWPVVEYITRDICLAYRLPTAALKSKSFPQTRPLGPLLNDLSPLIEDEFAWYLEAALVDGWSLNLRNQYAHGHAPNVDDGIAYAILFHVVCVLREIKNSGFCEPPCEQGNVDSREYP